MECVRRHIEKENNVRFYNNVTNRQKINKNGQNTEGVNALNLYYNQIANIVNTLKKMK